MKERGLVLAMIDEAGLESALCAGRIMCPGCGGSLRPWGFAREREVRMRHGGRLARPRRAYCRGCQRSHVLLPAYCVARRRDCAEVIGAALVAKAQGQGHRTIAARLDRAPGTVRGWLRAFARGAAALGRLGVSHTAELGDDPWLARASERPFDDALDALACAARACVLRFGHIAPIWELIVAICAGELLHGQRDPPEPARAAWGPSGMDAAP